MSTGMILILALFFIFLFAGFPVMYALGLPAVFWLAYSGVNSTMVATNMLGYLNSFTLLCLPGFMLVGRLMDTCGITDRLFTFCTALLGRFRGGMAYANAVTSAMFASMSGSAIADAGGLGVVEMNMMKRAGYDPGFAAGITAASSIIGPIIPPSAAMVMVGTLGNISVAKMFVAGVLPGLCICGMLCLNVWFRAHFSEDGKKWPSTIVPGRVIWKSFLRAVPSLFTFVIIMGSIIAGICTSTEAAVLAVWYALFLGICYKKVTVKNLWKTLKATATGCGPLFIIMTSASVFTWILTFEGLSTMVNRLIGAYIGVLDTRLIVGLCVVIFLILGCFIDTSSGVLICAPVMMPIMRSFGVDMVYFGVLMVFGLMIGIITPPFGICLFVVAGVAKLPVSVVTKEAIRYLPAMVVLCILFTLFPEIVTFLPNLEFGA